MKISKRLAALLIAALMLVFACACADKKEEPAAATPEPAKPVSTDPDEADMARIMALAAAFDRFGGFTAEEGVPVSSMEYMIYCWYCDKLEECETAGFGKVPFDEADRLVCSVFGNDEIKLVIRTKFDPVKEQDYYALNGYYYVRITQPEHEYRFGKSELIRDEEGAVTGLNANVDVLEGGSLTYSVGMVLGRGSDGEYCVKSCIFSQYI